MASPSTSIIDHTIHLAPPGSLPETTRHFRSMGFNVIAGGIHVGGMTENSLVILPDGSYIELVVFTHPVDYYPIGSPERSQRESHPWAKRQLGWINYANLGTSATISQTINTRAEKEGTAVRYLPEIPGGRETANGKVIKWMLTNLDLTNIDDERLFLPFFCRDVTPREWRVPIQTDDHPNKAVGITHIRILASEQDHAEVSRMISTVLDSTPLRESPTEVVWNLHAQKSSNSEPMLILSSPADEAEREYVLTHGKSLYEIGFCVNTKQGSTFSVPGYGRVVLVPS